MMIVAKCIGLLSPALAEHLWSLELRPSLHLVRRVVTSDGWGDTQSIDVPGSFAAGISGRALVRSTMLTLDGRRIVIAHLYDSNRKFMKVAIVDTMSHSVRVIRTVWGDATVINGRLAIIKEGFPMVDKVKGGEPYTWHSRGRAFIYDWKTGLLKGRTSVTRSWSLWEGGADVSKWLYDNGFRSAADSGEYRIIPRGTDFGDAPIVCSNGVVLFVGNRGRENWNRGPGGMLWMLKPGPKGSWVPKAITKAYSANDIMCREKIITVQVYSTEESGCRRLVIDQLSGEILAIDNASIPIWISSMWKTQ